MEKGVTNMEREKISINPRLQNSAVQNHSAKAVKMQQISDFVAEAPG